MFVTDPNAGVNAVDHFPFALLYVTISKSMSHWEFLSLLLLIVVVTILACFTYVQPYPDDPFALDWSTGHVSYGPCRI